MNGTLPRNSQQNSATQPQVAFLHKLLDEYAQFDKGASSKLLQEVGLKVSRGTLTRREASSYIDRLREVLQRARQTAGVAVEAPTEGQIQFAKDLLAKIELYSADAATNYRKIMNQAYLDHKLTRQVISETIETLKEALARHRAEAAEQGHSVNERTAQGPQDFDGPVPQVPSGCYAVSTDEGHLAFYRVTSLTAKEIDEDGAQFSPDVHFAVELQVSESFQDLGWKQALTILRKIEAAGVLECSIAYGKHMKVCGVCGTKITNPKSRERGIGPTCFDRLSQ